MISVIIPLFNVERFIEECLRSLENQIYKKNFEVLIINDGSTDNSVFHCGRIY
ncbi:glycosyltransferase family 2 protein [Paenibacillus rhizoplanae]